MTGAPNPADGVPITQADFDAQLTRYLRAFDEDRGALDDSDYVAMVRLWNTLQWGASSTPDSLRDAYSTRFFPDEVATVTGALKMTPSKGMALYSRERDLYLGGSPHANSMYKVLPG